MWFLTRFISHRRLPILRRRKNRGWCKGFLFPKKDLHQLCVFHMSTSYCTNPLVSIIVPVHNGEQWINDCFEAILKQDVLKDASIEVSVHNDCSNDNTALLLQEWEKKFSEANISTVVSNGSTKTPKGVGYAKNRAVEQSKGKYLCFQDIDDIMLPSRISHQLKAAMEHPQAIIGSQIKRLPENSTIRYTAWLNDISQDSLTKQIFTSHGPTVAMPTWFCARSVYDKVGQFAEQGKGTPEDLLFFYDHLDCGGTLYKVNEILVIYRYHSQCATFSISEDAIWDIRLLRLERTVLPGWNSFTIWNAGKQGKRFYRSLGLENRNKVTCFCDVDLKKIGKCYEPYDVSTKDKKRHVPIVSYTEAKPPIIICVKMGFAGSNFEENLRSLNLKEGEDYILFS